MKKTHQVTVTGAAYCGRVHGENLRLVDAHRDTSVMVTCRWCRRKLGLLPVRLGLPRNWYEGDRW